MNRRQFGFSDTAEAFGARIDISIPDQGLYLVVEHGLSPVGLIRQSGGRIIFDLANHRALAVLPTQAFLAFRSYRQIAFIGPVNVEQERFARFMTLMKQSQPPTNG